MKPKPQPADACPGRRARQASGGRSHGQRAGPLRLSQVVEAPADHVPARPARQGRALLARVERRACV